MKNLDFSHYSVCRRSPTKAEIKKGGKVASLKRCSKYFRVSFLDPLRVANPLFTTDVKSSVFFIQPDIDLCQADQDKLPLNLTTLRSQVRFSLGSAKMGLKNFTAFANSIFKKNN